MATFLSNISVKELRKAINLRERIENLQRALGEILGSTEPGSTRGAGRGKISAAGRARIAAAQRARWAKVKGESGGSGRRKMSAAGRAKISAAAKKRWAAVKAKGKRTLAG